MRTIYLIIMLGFAQTDTMAQWHNAKIYNCYLQQDMDKWQQHVQQMQTQLPDTSLQLLFAQYGLAAYYTSQKQHSKALIMLDSLDMAIQKAIPNSPQSATLWAMRAGTMGLYIAISPYKAIYLAVASHRYMRRALQIDASNPYALAEHGNSYFYRPSIVGGSKSKAIHYYKQAIAQMEQSHSQSQNWYYIHILATLGQAYHKTQQWQQADSIYRKTLQIAPTYKWLHEKHYPAFSKKYELHISNHK